MHFKGLFLRSMYRMGIFFGVANFLKIFLVLDIPDSFFFVVNNRFWDQAYV